MRTFTPVVALLLFVSFASAANAQAPATPIAPMQSMFQKEFRTAHFDIGIQAKGKHSSTLAASLSSQVNLRYNRNMELERLHLERLARLELEAQQMRNNHELSRMSLTAELKCKTCCCAKTHCGCGEKHTSHVYTEKCGKLKYKYSFEGRYAPLHAVGSAPMGHR